MLAKKKSSDPVVFSKHASSTGSWLPFWRFVDAARIAPSDERAR